MGKTFLKIMNIIFIIFGAIATIIIIIAFINGTSVSVATILLLTASIIELICGFIGYRRSSDPSDSGFFIVTGFIAGIIMLISMILGFAALNLIGFVLAAVYIMGGYMLRRSAA